MQLDLPDRAEERCTLRLQAPAAFAGRFIRTTAAVLRLFTAEHALPPTVSLRRDERIVHRKLSQRPEIDEQQQGAIACRVSQQHDL